MPHMSYALTQQYFLYLFIASIKLDKIELNIVIIVLEDRLISIL